MDVFVGVKHSHRLRACAFGFLGGVSEKVENAFAVRSPVHASSPASHTPWPARASYASGVVS
jgi:hypothetical protein